ncbi:hypothetical protein nvc2_011 [Namao virus]|nr:hypothetical protein nvc2_011 [Namao virus]
MEIIFTKKFDLYALEFDFSTCCLYESEKTSWFKKALSTYLQDLKSIYHHAECIDKKLYGSPVAKYFKSYIAASLRFKERDTLTLPSKKYLRGISDWIMSYFCCDHGVDDNKYHIFILLLRFHHAAAKLENFLISHYKVCYRIAFITLRFNPLNIFKHTPFYNTLKIIGPKSFNIQIEPAFYSLRRLNKYLNYMIKQKHAQLSIKFVQNPICGRVTMLIENCMIDMSSMIYNSAHFIVDLFHIPFQPLYYLSSYTGTRPVYYLKSLSDHPFLSMIFNMRLCYNGQTKIIPKIVSSDKCKKKIDISLSLREYITCYKNTPENITVKITSCDNTPISAILTKDDKTTESWITMIKS